MSLNKTNQYRRWIFKNSVKLNLKRLDKPISHKVLFCAQDVVLNQVENDAITSIYNFSSNKVWIIEFNAAMLLMLPKFSIVTSISMKLFSDLKMQINFRISEEKYKPERKNGVRRVRISFPKEVENIIGSLSGPTIMYGHNIAKWPVKETLCEKCHQKGHLTKKCSIAEELKSLESPQDLKTPVLEDNLVSRLNDFLPLCKSHVRSNDQNETETFFQTKNQIKRFSESDPNEKEFRKRIKKP
ncbi:hypothetical protein BpHYR1_052619 [Brachionus plicatilis]|uniref:Uncharacterized protein n=1 Tax=Brachionus plicatilis TaxID=10195 RepID=A0A3M7R6K9_BRAPC|nr:hypothetical protein BpHYR1_052619 [Brachionus plicatilis]